MLNIIYDALYPYFSMLQIYFESSIETSWVWNGRQGQLYFKRCIGALSIRGAYKRVMYEWSFSEIDFNTISQKIGETTYLNINIPSHPNENFFPPALTEENFLSAHAHRCSDGVRNFLREYKETVLSSLWTIDEKNKIIHSYPSPLSDLTEGHHTKIADIEQTKTIEKTVTLQGSLSLRGFYRPYYFKKYFSSLKDEFDPENPSFWLAEPIKSLNVSTVSSLPSLLSSPWPAPRAKVPILWSEESMARFIASFAKGFEANIAFLKKSWVDAYSNLQSNFSLFEKIDKEFGLPQFDCEGTLRENKKIFNEKKPLYLASTLVQSQFLGITPRGNSRRNSFLSNEEGGFYSLDVIPNTTVIRTNLLEDLDFGVFIKDISIEAFDYKKSNITFSCHHAFLIHNGLISEPIEPFSLEMNFVHLLEGFKLWGKEKKRIGLVTSKPICYSVRPFFDEKKELIDIHVQVKSFQKDEYLLYIDTPMALSSPLLIEGAVPFNQYWEDDACTTNL